MNTTINCITLPVEDIKQSYIFYRQGLGLSAEEPDEAADHIAFKL